MPTKKSSTKTTKSKKSTPPAKKVEPAPVATPVVDAPPAPVESDASDNYESEFTQIQSQLKDAVTLIKSLTSQVTKLEKRVQHLEAMLRFQARKNK